LADANTSQQIHRVGFISPPAWFDVSPTEFAGLAPNNVAVMQTVMRPPDFDYSLEHIAGAVAELKDCARLLAAAGADVVSQFGYPFSFVHGWPGAERVQEDIQQNANVPFVMMGVEMVHALRCLNCTRVAVASTYYSHAIETRLQSYLRDAGVDAVCVQNWQTQGIVDSTDECLFVGKGELDPMGWQNPVRAIEEAVRQVHSASPDVDCILVTGGGMRLLRIVEALEKETGTTIVAGDLSLYWGVLRRLPDSMPVKNHGRLLAAVGRSRTL
jgi:maleate cis-trans isomerase